MAKKAKKKHRASTSVLTQKTISSPQIDITTPITAAGKTSRWVDSRSLISVALLAIIIMCALWLRMDDLLDWVERPQRAFFNSQPILINFDGYYYLSLARDLVQGTYESVDALRGVPQSPLRPLPPPLISVLAAVLAMLTPFSLDWIATLLPPFLGITLAVPLFLICRLYAGRVMALSAVAMGLFPSYFVYRSNLGWYDTDCLNVTFLLLVCYFFIRFGLDDSRRRYAYLASGGITYVLFMLWWDQTPAIVTLLCFSPLAIVGGLYYRPQGRERRLAIIIGLIALVGVVVWQGPKIMVAPFEKAIGQLSYISKTQQDDFPNVGVSVHEQRRLDLANIVKKTTNHPLSFVIGLTGLMGLFWSHKRKAAALLVPFAIGCLSFLFARRFLIFLNPFLALGFGYAGHWLWQLRKKWPPLRYAVPVAIFVLLWIPFNGSLGEIQWAPAEKGAQKGFKLPKVDKVVYWPKEPPPIIEGLDAAKHHTDKDALVWAWWDHGYPMLYWGQRATINDGSLHGGLRTVINAIPLATQSPRLSANFMRFYSVQGISGLARLFKAMRGTAQGMHVLKAVLSAQGQAVNDIITQAGLAPLDEWRSFFFPESSRELYLFTDFRLARTTYWWHWFGTWDVANREGVHPQFKLIVNCRRKGDIIAGGGIMVNVQKGQATWSNKRLDFKSMLIHDGQRWQRRDDGRNTGMLFIYDSRYRIAVIAEQAFADTVFSRLYFLKQPDPDYFSPVANNFPYYQIWKVHPDPALVR